MDLLEERKNTNQEVRILLLFFVFSHTLDWDNFGRNLTVHFVFFFMVKDSSFFIIFSRTQSNWLFLALKVVSVIKVLYWSIIFYLFKDLLKFKVGDFLRKTLLAFQVFASFVILAKVHHYINFNSFDYVYLTILLLEK